MPTQLIVDFEAPVLLKSVRPEPELPSHPLGKVGRLRVGQIQTVVAFRWLDVSVVKEIKDFQNVRVGG